MKKLITLMLALMPVNIACQSVAPSAVTAPQYAYPSASPSGLSAPGSTGLDGLKLGVLPNTSLSDEEQRLAGILSRQVKPQFPLKLGVILYKTSTQVEDKLRKDNYNKFIEKLRSNPDVGLVQDISPTLISSGANVEDLRSLAARFQVSTLLIISDSYQLAKENKNTLITPIDIVSGLRNWESSSNIEVFALDVLNGVFVSTINSNITMTEKYNKNSINENKENALTIKTVNSSWDDLATKTAAKIAEFKQQAGN